MSDLPPRAGVLFDLDGTLLDSAPDLAAALQQLCTEQGRAMPAYAIVREVVSHGASAVIRSAWPDASAETIAALLPRFLAIYGKDLAARTRPFAGIESLLEALDRAGTPWGIVTNKISALTLPLLGRLGLAPRAAAIVAGDTLALKKPDPAPVLHACTLAGIAPRRSLFIGDDRRDVEAGRAAGLFTVAAAWGYLGGEDPAAWAADALVATPQELLVLLRRHALCA